MKKSRRLLFALVPTLMFLTSCVEKPSFLVEYYVDDKLYETASVKKGAVAPKLTVEDKETYAFKYWTTENGDRYKFNIFNRVESDLRLYAHFEYDTEVAEKTIRNSYISGHFLVHNTTIFNGKFLFFNIEKSAEAYGSGFVFDKIGDTYYALTNSHVALGSEAFAKQRPDPSKISITLEDSDGETVSANVLSYDVSYDLALMSFSSSKTYRLFNFSEDAEVGENCIAIGNPNLKRDVISHGKIKAFETAELNCSKYFSDVKFPVIKHTARIRGGSSGGPLLNDRLEIIGVNYGREYFGKTGYAVPCWYVKEFIENYP